MAEKHWGLPPDWMSTDDILRRVKALDYVTLRCELLWEAADDGDKCANRVLHFNDNVLAFWGLDYLERLEHEIAAWERQQAQE